jgi:F-type H+-transporting ATPase subunit gamma
MASLRDIKIRIKSVQSTSKITKAMEMIAASKMKRAQTMALRGRPYIQKLEEVIGNLVNYSNPPLSHPFLNKRGKVRNAGYIFITSNRGLCGAFNSNIIRRMLEILREKNETGEIVLTVGKKGRQAMERIGKTVLADFEQMPDKPSFLDTIGISRVVIDDFLSGKLDEVYMVYNHFYSLLTQKPVVKKLLPIESKTDEFSLTIKRDYIFEQSREKLLDELLRRYVENMVYQTVLESVASEHSARMMAMRLASDNAGEIITNLTLKYNKTRQAKITTEILEVMAGANAS